MDFLKLKTNIDFLRENLSFTKKKKKTCNLQNMERQCVIERFYPNTCKVNLISQRASSGQSQITRFKEFLLANYETGVKYIIRSKRK